MSRMEAGSSPTKHPVGSNANTTVNGGARSTIMFVEKKIKIFIKLVGYYIVFLVLVVAVQKCRLHERKSKQPSRSSIRAYGNGFKPNKIFCSYKCNTQAWAAEIEDQPLFLILYDKDYTHWKITRGRSRIFYIGGRWISTKKKNQKLISPTKKKGKYSKNIVMNQLKHLRAISRSSSIF